MKKKKKKLRLFLLLNHHISQQNKTKLNGDSFHGIDILDLFNISFISSIG